MVPPRPIRTAALRRAGERTDVSAPPRRGGSVEIALPGTARLAPGVAGNSKQLIANPAQPESTATNESAAARLSGVLLYVLLHCCTAVLGRSVGGWWVVVGWMLLIGGWWVGGGWRLARSPRWPSIVKK